MTGRVDRRTDEEKALRWGDSVIVKLVDGSEVAGRVKRVNRRGATIRLGPTMECRVVFGKGAVRRA